MVSRGLNEQISLNKTSIYSNQSASRLPATVGRSKNRRCHFPQRPSLPNSSSATGGRTWKFSRRVSWAVYYQKGSVPQLYIYLGSCWRRLRVKNIRCLQFKFTLLFIYILSGTFFFLVIPFYRPGKFPLNYRWSQVVPKRLKSGVSFSF